MALPILDWPKWDEAPPPLREILPGLILATVAAIISPGGTGKSILLLQLLLKIAGIADLLGFGEKYVEGKVAYMPAEDPKEVLQHRLFALQRYLTPAQYASAPERITIHPLVGQMPDINKTKWFDEIRRAAEGRLLLAIDTLRRFHRAEENHTGEMSDVIGKFEMISHETGCVIMFAHHTAKAAALNGQVDQQQASRGASVLTDNIRWQAYLMGVTAESAKELELDPEERGYFVRFGLSKSNYGPPVAERVLRRTEGGILLPATVGRARARHAGNRSASPNARSASPIDLAVSSSRYRAASRGGE